MKIPQVPIPAEVVVSGQDDYGRDKGRDQFSLIRVAFEGQYGAYQGETNNTVILAKATREVQTSVGSQAYSNKHGMMNTMLATVSA